MTPHHTTPHPEQHAIDQAQERVAAHQTALIESERAHRAGLLTGLLPDAEAFYGTGEAVEYGTSPVPDAMISQQHTVKRGRSKRGETRQVTHAGVPFVTGDTRVTHASSDGTVSVPPGLLALALDPESPHAMVRRRRVGLNAIDVTRVADAFYGPLGLEPLVGTESPSRRHGNSWSEIIPCDRSDAYRLAYAAGHVDRSLSTATVEIEQHDGTRRLVERATHHTAETVERFRSRYSLRRVRVRKSETAHATPRRARRVTVRGWSGSLGRVRSDAIVRRWSLVPLVASADRPDAVFYGHRLVERGATRTAPPRQVRRARTIGTVATEIETEAGWQAVADMLAAGERVEIEHGAARVTITRAASGRYSGTVVLPSGDRVTIAGARTTTALARRILLATS